MNRPDEFEEAAMSLKAHPSQARILLEVSRSDTTLERAKAVLRGAGLEMAHQDFLREGDLSWVLLTLSSGDMREAVFLLTEAGFTKLKGINPKNEPFLSRRSQKSSGSHVGNRG